MSIKVTIDSSHNEIPQVGDTNWGEKTTELLNAIVSALNNRSKLSGNESISGIKTFTSPPIIPQPLLPSNPIRKKDLNNFQISLTTLQSSVSSIKSTISTVNNSISSLENQTQSNDTDIADLRNNITTNQIQLII